MSKLKLLSIAVGLLVTTNLAVLFFVFTTGNRRPPHGRPDREGPKRIIIEKLHFDEDQIRHYDKLIQYHQRSTRGLEDEIRKTKNELYLTLSGNGKAQKDSLLNELSVLQKRIEAVNYDHFTDIRKICRPDQIADYNALTRELATFFSPHENFPPPPKD